MEETFGLVCFHLPLSITSTLTPLLSTSSFLRLPFLLFHLRGDDETLPAIFRGFLQGYRDGVSDHKIMFRSDTGWETSKTCQCGQETAKNCSTSHLYE